MGKNYDLVFDDPAIQVPVRVDGGKYLLLEASGEVTVAYRNEVFRNIRLDNGKPVGFGNLTEIEPLLVSLCLYTVENPDDAESVWRPKERVPQRLVRSWPGRIQKRLFEVAKEISQLQDITAAPVETVLAEALSREDAPIGMADLRRWAEGLDPEDFPRKDDLLKLLTPTAEEVGKN